MSDQRNTDRSTKGKILALLLMILSALVSTAGFLFLAGKIAAGERQIADGQKQFQEGYLALEEGESRLEAGRLMLSEGKEKYARTEENPFLMLADWLLAGRLFSRAAEKRIAAGDKRVAVGAGKTNVAQVSLDAGELKLLRGRSKLRLAEGASVACAVGAVCFASLSVVFGFRWRRSLVRTSTHTDA